MEQIVFKKIKDELPDNNMICWVYIPGRGLLLTEYQNDSFGLGDEDFKVTMWSRFKRTNLDPTCHCHNLKSKRQAGDHTIACFGAPLVHLVQSEDSKESLTHQSFH